MTQLNNSYNGWTIIEAMAANTPADEQTLNTLMAIMRLGYHDVIEMMYLFVPEAYNGLNRECGDWAKAMLNLAIEKAYS